MGNLLLAVILGLFAFVHSTPVDIVTQIPTKPEDDVFREAITDGFLVDLPTLTTESPKISTTTPTSPQPSAEPKESHDMEGSASGESPISIFFQQHTTASHSSKTSGPEDFSGDAQGSGSGFEETILTTSARPTTETSTAPSASVTAAPSTNNNQMLTDNEGSGSSGSGLKSRMQINLFSQEIPKPGQTAELESADPTTGYHKGHSTPDWIIILGFIVGVAALVMLCAAIATRDKWNGPNQTSMNQESKTDSSNQQRELEMETFLHKKEPRENGKAAEYTVIPLDELPEDYSSH